MSGQKIRDRMEFVEKCRSFRGVKFLHRGRDRSGVDCGGLILAALVELGYKPPEMTVYGREPEGDRLRQYLIRAIGQPIPKEEMQVGDVALMRFVREPHHVAVIGDYKMCPGAFSLIHSYGASEKVVEHRLDSDWHDKIIEVYRFEILEK